jgi:alkanesulfonate monooxygenase SsuD/methylene tetrahydromethanopterin reductase-like flavin-dependent oxidoreductase (luciferase family)
LWRDDPATFRGEFVRFERVFCDTKPVQPGGIPFYIGGSSEAAARRAGLRGEGFYPYVISPEDLAARMARCAARHRGRAAAREFFGDNGRPVSAGATFDIGWRAFRDAGADRLLIAGYEAGATPGAAGLVAGFRDRIAGALSSAAAATTNSPEKRACRTDPRTPVLVGIGIVEQKERTRRAREAIS